VPEVPSGVDLDAAVELTGVRRSTCAALLRSPWLRRPGSPPDRFTVVDVVLLAADRFGLRAAERDRFFARWCQDVRVERPMTFARRRDGTIEIAAGDEAFASIPLRARQRVTATFSSNDDLLRRFAQHVAAAR